MSAPCGVLDEIRATLDELMALLEEHREYAVLPGVRHVRALAEPEADAGVAPGPDPVEVDRAYWALMGIPDGLSALYFPAPGGGVDRDATRRLDDLRTRMAQLLRIARGEPA